MTSELRSALFYVKKEMKNTCDIVALWYDFIVTNVDFYMPGGIATQLHQKRYSNFLLQNLDTWGELDERKLKISSNKWIARQPDVCDQFCSIKKYM